MYGMRFWSYFFIGDKLRSATDVDRLLVFSGLSTQNFNLIGNDDCLSCPTDFRPKMSPKMSHKLVTLSFLGYLSEIESNSQTVRT